MLELNSKEPLTTKNYSRKEKNDGRDERQRKIRCCDNPLVWFHDVLSRDGAV